MAYERIISTEDGIGRMVYLSRDLDDPYDHFCPRGQRLPEPWKSTLRTVLDDDLMEISFYGRVNLKFHSWWDEKINQKYWKIITPEEGKKVRREKDLAEAILKQQIEYSKDR